LSCPSISACDALGAFVFHVDLEVECLVGLIYQITIYKSLNEVKMGR